MTFNYNENYGVIDNFLNDSEINYLVDHFKTWDPTPIGEGTCYGVDYKHPDNDWYLENFFNKYIKKVTNKDNLHTVFAMFADFEDSFQIHTDVKPLPEYGEGIKHYASFMIPVSIDNDPTQCEKNCTLFFGNVEHTVENHDYSHRDWQDLVPHSRHNFHLHECERIIQWKRGSLIWWNSHFYHSGADPSTIGIRTKQMFVIHTYVK